MNVIRHSLFADVPVLAANTVTFIQYNGPLEPETIAHRIGQLPLRFFDAGVTQGVSAVPDASPSSLPTATFSIDVRTSADVPRLTWVTSQDVTCTSRNAEVVHYRSDAERAAADRDSGFLVCPLHAGQRFVATFTGIVATARRATRWNSVHPIVRPHGDGTSFDVTIQTTGALLPRAALRHALVAILDRLRAISTGCDALLEQAASHK